MLKRGASSGISLRPNCWATSSGVVVSVKRPHMRSARSSRARGYRLAGRAEGGGGAPRRAVALLSARHGASGSSHAGDPARGGFRAGNPPCEGPARRAHASCTHPGRGPPPRYDRMPSFRSHTVALIAATTLAPGCVYYGDTEPRCRSHADRRHRRRRHGDDAGPVGAELSGRRQHVRRPRERRVRADPRADTPARPRARPPAAVASR